MIIAYVRVACVHGEDHDDGVGWGFTFRMTLMMSMTALDSIVEDVAVKTKRSEYGRDSPMLNLRKALPSILITASLLFLDNFISSSTCTEVGEMITSWE